MGRGSYCRYNAKISTEDLLSVSLADMKRHGAVKPGIGYTLKWSRGGRQTGAINYDLAKDSMTFRYTNTPYGGPPVPVRVVIQYAFTACHYGGQRKWFKCGCGRSVVRLFIKGQRVACRHCLNLAYGSQREDLLDRLHRKIEKVQSRLKDCQSKPKGMHWQTFKEIQGKIYRLESLKWKVLESEYARRFPGMTF
ncbi:hypothetical protein Gbem_2987 [Citrifermentans bemidjiense Bem]|uniref:Uncharacterized protein n=1 Tax=Citrifermentans bemidjiense (strain ATCC BAA-1014 / DSM 16622 / JCM 12645 / Bem) TaxID=404380 RepID=B5E821_CITBB|nr:hypothetical protein [Citrifermentans bemidjiense]ACH39990.1 hypothetical protein Gbem_2987 [Citrifermentans bemidjiense Bem]